MLRLFSGVPIVLGQDGGAGVGVRATVRKRYLIFDERIHAA